MAKRYKKSLAEESSRQPGDPLPLTQPPAESAAVHDPFDPAALRLSGDVAARTSPSVRHVSPLCPAHVLDYRR